MPSARPAQIQDKELLEELLKLAISEVKDQRGGAMYLLTEVRNDFSDLEMEIEEPTKQLVVGVYENLVVGWGLALENQIPDGPKIGDVKELYVQPEARGIGVGETMLSTLIDWATMQKCQAVQGTALPGNRESKGIFERFGLTTRMLTVYKELPA